MNIPPGPLTRDSADSLNRQLAELRAMMPASRISSAIQGGVAADNDPNLPFPSKLLASDNLGKYGWVEQQPDGPSTWTNRIGGRFGTTSKNPFMDANACPSLPVGMILWMRRGNFDPDLDWLYTNAEPNKAQIVAVTNTTPTNTGLYSGVYVVANTNTNTNTVTLSNSNIAVKIIPLN